MTCCRWSQIGVDSVESLEELEDSDFEKLETQIKAIPYRRLLKGMAQRGFTNVPSVPPCP